MNICDEVAPGHGVTLHKGKRVTDLNANTHTHADSIQYFNTKISNKKSETENFIIIFHSLHIKKKERKKI